MPLRRCAHIATILEGKIAVHRIGIVDRLQFDRHRLLPGNGHRLKPDPFRYLAQARQFGALGIAEAPLPDRKLDVATQQFLPACGKLLLDSGSQRSDCGQRAGAQEQANKQQPQSLETRG